jgi:uncharacterized surface protein with fasciclin (FAS1) repeats
MTHRYHTLPLFLLAVAVVLAGCDQSSLNNEPNSPNEYIINQANSAVGDAVSGSFRGSTPNENPTVTVPDTVDYFVEGFTTEKPYNWTVNDSDVPVEGESETSYVWESRDGEFVTLYYTPGDPLVNADASQDTTMNTFSVNSPDDDINAETLEITTTIPSLVGQVSRLGSFSTLATAVTSATIDDVLADGGPYTVLGPRVAAFDTLNALPTQAIDPDEDTTSSVRGQILQYHALSGTIEAGDIQNGQSVPTLLGPDVTFSVSSGAVTINNDRAAVVKADIPVTEGALHRLDRVLLPPAGLADFTNRTLPDTSTAQGDTLVVDGTSFPEGGGFIVLHDQQELQNQGAIPSIVGVSEYLEPGIHNEVKIALDEDITQTSTIGAMPHQDTDGDEQYDFQSSGGTQDGPYQLNGQTVIDYADIEVTDPDA